MKLLILSPLFPPDTASSAAYTKELTKRLSLEHEVTVLLYGHLPEQVENATLVTVKKSTSVLKRALSFMKQFIVLARKSDAILIQNGPSVELPALLVLLFTNVKTILMQSDGPALKRTLGKQPVATIHKLLEKVITSTYTQSEPWPSLRPIIHPLKEWPSATIDEWHQSWKKHLSNLLNNHLKL